MHSNTILALFGLVASTSAHMKMASPSGWDVNNSPLNPDGSDFPCKNPDYNGPAVMNTYMQGQSAPLTFIGQAVHGGGSCQVVLTKDTVPTKDSVWKVIKSIEGGCPAQGEAGNMGGNAEAEDPYKYDFVVPSKIPAGEYTIAWTWFNKIGNREMYMNCGPATVTGDEGDESFFNSLPDMFTANLDGIEDDKCHHVDNTDLEFPNPGQFVQRLNGATDAFSPPNQHCMTAGAAPNAGGAPSAAAPTPSAAAPSPSAGDAGKDDKLPGGVFATVDSSADAPAPTAPAQLPEPESAADQEDDSSDSEADPAVETPAETPAEAIPVDFGPPAADSSASDGSSTSDSSPSSGEQPVGSACSNEGYWNCIGGASFQRCASGQWSSVMALGGMECSGGISAEIALTRRGRPVRASRLFAKMMI